MVLLLDLSFRFFQNMRINMIFNIKNQIRSNFYHKKLEKKVLLKDVKGREKDQKGRRVFFLVHSLEEEEVFLSDIFLFFFRIKIRLDLIFNIKIQRKNIRKIQLDVWGFLKFQIKKKKGEEERRMVLLLGLSFGFFQSSKIYIISAQKIRLYLIFIIENQRRKVLFKGVK